jgi:hypothetical protein
MPEYSVIDNRFWLQGMGDHARIILIALSSLEEEEIEKCRGFISLFDGLLEEARGDLDAEQARSLCKRAVRATRDIRAFKLHLIVRKLTDTIYLNITAALINHMVNEADEYLFMLGYYVRDKSPVLPPIHLHRFWLVDAIGHTSYIQQFVGYPFKEIRDQAHAFEMEFTTLNNRAMEYAGYMRSGLREFPALSRLNRDAYEQYKLFAEFFVDLLLKFQNKEVIGFLTIIFLDHMYRESCYYLTQLAKVTDLQRPACDPASERMEDPVKKEP